MSGRTRTHQLLAFLASGALCGLVDQAAKAWIVASLAPGERAEYAGGFLQLVHMRNPGAAFGLLGGLQHELRVAIFATLFALAALLVLSMLRSVAPGERGAIAWAVALGALLGGASSNLIDRLLPGRGGEVVDYLHVRLWGGYAWPDFNLADASIVFALMAVVVQLSTREGEARARAHRDENDA